MTTTPITLRFRWFNRAKAALTGRYWMPCPICGEEYGGHEEGQVGLCSLAYAPEQGIAIAQFQKGVCKATACQKKVCSYNAQVRRHADDMNARRAISDDYQSMSTLGVQTYAPPEVHHKAQWDRVKWGWE